MRCRCGSQATNVVNSYKADDVVYRMRVCKECKSVFYTEEIEGIDQEFIQERMREKWRKKSHN